MHSFDVERLISDGGRLVICR